MCAWMVHTAEQVGYVVGHYKGGLMRSDLHAGMWLTIWSIDKCLVSTKLIDDNINARVDFTGDPPFSSPACLYPSALDQYTHHPNRR